MRFLVLLLLLLTSCSSLPHLTLGKDKVVVPANTNNTTLEKGETKSTLSIPADTKVTTTHTGEIPATPTTPYRPSVDVTEWTFLRPTSFDVAASSLKADSGKIDTSLAQHQVDVTAKQPYLYASIACIVAAIVAMFLKYPTGVMLCLVASGIFFAMWKLSDIPSWLLVVAVSAIVGAVFLVIGHEKGESVPKAPATQVTPATT